MADILACFGVVVAESVVVETGFSVFVLALLSERAALHFALALTQHAAIQIKRTLLRILVLIRNYVNNLVRRLNHQDRNCHLSARPDLF